MNSKKVMVVGIGMNGSETLTEYAKKLIESADILIGAERILKCFEYLKNLYCQHITAVRSQNFCILKILRLLRYLCLGTADFSAVQQGFYLKFLIWIMRLSAEFLQLFIFVQKSV